MRVISGKYKGKVIQIPGSLGIRPTTDFAKVGLFNILSNYFDFSNLKILDLFSGSGSISFEFFSRGCKDISIVEQNPKCIYFIKKMFEEFGIKNVNLIKGDVFRFLANCSEQYDIIFADPPFEIPKLNLLPELVLKKSLLRNKGWFIFEHSHSIDFEKITFLKEKRVYGNVAFSIFENT